MNPDLAKLRPYPFQRWRALKATVTPPTDRRLISLGIGEPKHAQPEPVLEVLRTELDLVGRYPPTQGTLELREAIASWVTRRFGLSDGAVDPGRHVLPVNGTREALFSFVQAAIGRTEPGALVAMPNPYYQIYEGAALLAGAEPAFLPCSREGGYQPDLQSVPDSAWQRTKILFLCSPSNPTATVLPLETLQYALELADRFDFIVCADECYSEVYFDEQSPPPGLLDACRESGRTGFERAVVFHSLSKRSNLPGLRSGFVCGDASLLEPYLLYRTYHGCAMSLLTQRASAVAWSDEEHVRANRALYRQKLDAMLPILQGAIPKVRKPEASFYLWLPTPIDDCEFALRLFETEHVDVLPGRFLSRPGPDGFDPGAGHVRAAFVCPLKDCVEAAERIARFATALG